MPKLGSLTVSRQGFGAMGLSHAYGQANDAESIRTVHRAVELGVTFFDTATGYGAGHNETLLGQAIEDRLEYDLSFSASEVSAYAEVNSYAKGDVAIFLPLDVEPVRVSKVCGVPVCRIKHLEDHIPFVNLFAV